VRLGEGFVVDQHPVQETFRQAPGGAGDVVPASVSGNDSGAAEQAETGGDDEALARLTAALRAGLPGSGQGPDLLTGQMPPDADPFEFFGSGETRPQVDATMQLAHDLPWQSLSAGAGAVERRVALMAQDMAAFGGVGREAPLRLDPPVEGFRHEYFA
jgi:hypothetical protein